LYDFNPSPFSHRYLGVLELGETLAAHGFEIRCFGDTPIGGLSFRQRALRPIKAMAAGLGLIPGSMHAKRLLKRLVFGRLVPMPAEITDCLAARMGNAPLPPGVPDRLHKVIFCAAHRID
jgi:hypothetical protein